MLENRPEDEGQDTHHYKRVEKRPKHAQGHIPVADCKVLQDETFEKKPIVPVPHGCNVFRAATRRPDSPIVVPAKVKPQFRGEIGVCDVKVTRIQRRAKLRRPGSSWYLHCNGLSHVSRSPTTIVSSASKPGHKRTSRGQLRIFHTFSRSRFSVEAL